MLWWFDGGWVVVGQWEVRYNCQDGRLSFPATAEGKQEVDNKSDYLEPGHELLRTRPAYGN